MMTKKPCQPENHHFSNFKMRSSSSGTSLTHRFHVSQTNIIQIKETMFTHKAERRSERHQKKTTSSIMAHIARRTNYMLIYAFVYAQHYLNCIKFVSVPSLYAVNKRVNIVSQCKERSYPDLWQQAKKKKQNRKKRALRVKQTYGK